MPAEKNRLDLGLCPGLLASSANGVHSLNRDDSLSLGDPPSLLSILGQVGEEDVSHHSERKSDDAVNDEQPAPCLG